MMIPCGLSIGYTLERCLTGRSVVAPTEKGLKPVAVAQHVERIGITGLPPALELGVTQVRRAVHSWITPLPVGVLVAQPHVANVARTGVSEAEQIHLIAPQRHCRDKPQRTCGGDPGFLEQLAGGGLRRAFSRVNEPSWYAPEPDHHPTGPLYQEDLF